MKKILLFVIAAVCNNVYAQTLTQSFNEPKPGDVQTTIALDTSLFTSGLPLSQSGAGQSWNFSDLKANKIVYTTNYGSLSSSSYSLDFPSATVVQKEGPNFQIFLRSVSAPTTQTEVLGIRTTSLSTTFTDVAVAAKFPMSLGHSHTDNIAGTFTMSALSGKCSGKVTVTADATGTLTLPDGIVYNQVLRVKTTQTLTGTAVIITATITQTNYDFYDMTEKFLVFGVNYTRIASGFGTPTVTAGASGNAKSFLAGIKENSAYHDFTVFPSPAKNFLNLSCNECENEEATYEIADVTGKTVITAKKLREGSNQIDVANLQAGLYTVLLKSQGRQTAKKVVIE